MKKLLYVACAIFLLTACSSRKGTVVSDTNETEDTTFVWQYKEPQKAMALPSVIVYKTRKNYNNLVPVTLDPTASRIVSMPDPSDVHRGDGYATPTELENGYLLDNRGISKHSAFLSYTYEEYAALDSLPSLDELMSRIVDKHPIIEMWDCGKPARFNDKIEGVNELITSGFPGCTLVVGGTVNR